MPVLHSSFTLSAEADLEFGPSIITKDVDRKFISQPRDQALPAEQCMIEVDRTDAVLAELKELFEDTFASQASSKTLGTWQQKHVNVQSTPPTQLVL
jgi:hypothetical protein